MSPCLGHPRDSMLELQLWQLLLPWTSAGFCRQMGARGCQGSPDWAYLALFPRPESYGRGAPGEGRREGGRPCFLLTLQVAEEVLRVESIIDEESGCASALSGQGRGILAQAMAG